MSLLSDLFDAQLAVLKSDLAKDLIPKIQTANNLIAANPTLINVVAQGQSILTALISEGPTAMQDEIKALAQWINGELQQLAAPPAATSVSAAATAAPAK